MKLPFILCGILSVYFTFRIGKEWFNATTGFVSAAYIATIEYTIMYSQVARPYISGLFFSLAMVWYWNKIIFKPENKYYKNFCLYILFSACCAYNHHFSLLFATLVGLTGLLFVRKQYFLKYALSGICIFVLYIPHLHIFFYQLNIGGVGSWLGKPKNNFIFKFLEYVFQFSVVSYVCVALLFLTGLFSAILRKKIPLPYSIISFCWFLIPFLTGFFYSRYINPVLQYSLLIFCFPFLLFFFFGWLPELSAKKLAILLFIVCSVNVYSLVNVRDYYSVFYKSHTEQQVLLNDSILTKNGSNSCISVSPNSLDSLLAFYQKKYHSDIHYYPLPDSGGEYPFINYLEQNKKPFLVYDNFPGTNPIYLAIISAYYPTLAQQRFYWGGTVYLFSNSLDSKASPYIYYSENNFEHAVPYWSDPDKNFMDDSISFSGKPSYRFDSIHEFGPTFSCDLNKITSSKNDIILVSVEIYPQEKMDKIYLVSDIKSGDSTLNWTGSPVNSFLASAKLRQWQKVYLAIDLSGTAMDLPDKKIKIFLWNEGRRKFNATGFQIKTMKGNPFVYALSDKI